MTSDFDLGHRRMRTLGDLAVLVGGRTALDEVGPTAAAALAANNTDLPFVRLYRCAGPGEPRLVGAVPAGTEATDPAGVPAVLAEVIAGGMPVTLPAEHFTEQAGDVQRALATPLADGTETLGVLVAGLNPKLDQAGLYREFLDRVATMIAAALVTAGAYEQDQRSIAALSDLDRAKTDLFANASHELRTPLTLVSAPAEEALADTDEPLPPAQRERIRLVRRNAARLRRLLNNILDFTKITSGGLHAELVATELAEQTRAIAASFAPAVRRGGLEFVVDCPPLSRVAFVDREMWERIVLNLLSNALKFTLHGKITLRLAGDEHEVAMSVEDTGIGVPPEHVPLLFRRFHRVQGAVGRTGEGAGIGLALVHELVALHEGSVAVHSTLGAGSTFEVRIPYGSGAMSGVSRGPGWVREVHLAEAFGWVGSEAQEPLPGSTDGPPVLVAEDNIDMRNYLETLLAPHWPVRTAADGAAALALAKETRPALVLTDVSMPEMDGLALVDALRADPATQGIPIILLSAQAGVEATAAGLHAGADDYLVKPFSPVELLARVRSSIELAQLRQHHSEREAIQARFAVQLAEATDMRDVLSAAVAELGTSWDAGAVVVVSWDADGAGHVIAPPDGSSWETLPRHVRDVLDELRRRVGLAALARPADPATGAGAGVGATIDVLGDDTAVWLELPDNRPLASADRNLLRALCGQLGLALSRARSYEQQRTVAVTLQRSLLGPTVLPSGFAARYEPAQLPLEVGGDWYDVVELADGCIGLVVGDCVGRGLPAATVMGQLRSACRALLLQHNSPAKTLTALDGFAALLDGGACTTVFCARLDLRTGELTYSSAGHPPGIVVDVDGGHLLLDQAGWLPLTVTGPGARPEATVTLAPGSTLLLYTDGLVERGGVPIDTGIAAATAIVVAGRRVPEQALADRVLQIPDRRPGDDVVVLVHRVAAPDAVRYADSFPADPAELRPARLVLQDWLDDRGLDQDVVERMVLAAGEAWTNAIEHGYGLDPTRTVHSTASVSGGELEVVIADHGAWRPPGDPGNRGRGIMLMEGVCDEVMIDAGPSGTTVRLTIATSPPDPATAG